MGRIGCVRRENPNVTSWQELSHQLLQFTLFCVEFHVVTKRSQMHSNTMQHNKTCVSGPIGWIGCIRREKSRHYFLARTFASIAPVHPVLRRGSCSYEMIPNAPKHDATHQNMILRSNGADWVRSL